LTGASQKFLLHFSEVFITAGLLAVLELHVPIKLSLLQYCLDLLWLNMHRIALYS